MRTIALTVCVYTCTSEDKGTRAVLNSTCKLSDWGNCLTFQALQRTHVHTFKHVSDRFITLG